jgi:hypothetical protein
MGRNTQRRDTIDPRQKMMMNSPPSLEIPGQRKSTSDSYLLDQRELSKLILLIL